ncbi:MAG: NUDIX domain-containing protein [Minisyncoccota bacterium]
MTPERAALLGELLAELAADPKGFIPDEAWASAQKAFALSYIELAFVRRSAEGELQVLLSHRKDVDWNGWHLPGGLWRTQHTLLDAIASLSWREIGLLEPSKILAKGEWEKWHDHPYGIPVSHVVILHSDHIVETETVGWFTKAPPDMIRDHGHHRRFFNNVIRQVTKDRLV